MSDSAIPEGFSRIDRPDAQLILCDPYRAPLLSFFSTPLSVWETHPEARRHAGKGLHFSIPLPGHAGSVFVRRWRHGGAARGLGRWYPGPGRAMRELQALIRARRAGVPVPEPVALRIDRAPLGCRLTTVLGDVPHEGDLPSVLGAFDREESERRHLRRRLMARFGRAVGMMHRAGVIPADLHLRNVLVRKTANQDADICLVDLDPVTILDRNPAAVDPEGPVVPALARLLRSWRRWDRAGLRATRTDGARFLRGYAQGAGMGREALRRLLSRVAAAPAARMAGASRDARGVAWVGGGIPSPVSRILVRMPNWLGDAVMAMPLLEGIRRARPEAVLRVQSAAPLRDLFSLSPVEVSVIDERPEDGATRRDEDLILTVPRSLGAAWRGARGRGRIRIGFDGPFRRFLYTHRVRVIGAAAGRHRVHTYWALAAPLGAGPFPPPPRLSIPDSVRADVEARLANLGIAPGDLLVGLNPGAAYGPAKQWPPGRFAEVARVLACRGARILIFGSASEAPLAEAIARETGRAAVSVAGQTTLPQLAGLIARCRAFVTNDTGPMHVAAALDVPVVAVFGSTDPATTGPFGPRHRVVREPVPCSPCLLRRCPIDFRCMRAIGADRVLETLERMIA